LRFGLSCGYRSRMLLEFGLPRAPIRHPIIPAQHRSPATRWSVLVGVLALLVVASAAFCQDKVAGNQALRQQPELVVTPELASRLAVVSSHDLKINASTIEEARAKIREARGLSALRTSLSAGFTQQGPASGIEFMGERIEFMVTEVQSYTLAVTKNLYDFGRTKLSVDLARRGVALAEQQGKSIEQLAAELAAEQCYTVLLSRELQTVALQNAAALEEHRRVAERLYHEGLIAFFEVSQSRAEAARARQQVATAERQLEVERGKLRKLLVLPQSAPIRVKEGPLLPDPERDLEGCIAYAWEHRPDLKAAEQQIALAKASLGLAKRTSDPALVFAGDVTHRTASALAEPLTYRVGVRLDVPLMDGGIERAKVDQARSALDRARQQREKLKDEVADQVRKAWEYVREANAQQEQVAVEESAARELLRIQRVRYEATEGTGQEVIDATAALARARASVASVRFQRAMSLCKLRLAMGLPLWEEAP